MKRRLRKHPQHHPDHVDREHPRARKLPFGLMWLVLAAVVLVLVIGYDRRAINQAEAHIASGENLAKQGLYVEAVNEYEKALENSRLGRKAKAGVALAIADIHFTHMEDYRSAHRFYTQARQISASVFQDEEVQDRARMAATRAKQSGVFSKRQQSDDPSTTRTVVQRVELLNKPLVDTKGPIVVSYKGGEIRAGELLRALEKRPEFLQPDFREDPERLRAFLDGLIRENLAYEAAVSAEVHKDPDVTERLYDYQKSLVTQRYMVDRRDQAMLVDNEDVNKYYKEHIADYVQPGHITVSLLKADTETSAAEMLQMLRDGMPFHDVATSFSTHQESAVRGGNLGRITEKDTTIAGVGEAPHVIESLFKLPVMSVTEVTPIAGAYYIFKLTSVTPSKNVTVDEARGSIENIIRGRAVDQARIGLDEELQEAFAPKVDDKGLSQFWDFALQQGSYGDQLSTGTGATSPTSAVTTSTQVTTGTATSGKKEAR